MSTEFQKVVATEAERLASKMDELIAKFFGSPEDVNRYGHLYVLEATPTHIESMMQPEFTGEYFKVRTETRYRIRPKTQAELESDNHD
jgi:hypothetical protein